MKIDVEASEWPMLKEMLQFSSPQNVKQMIFEIHTPARRGQKLNLDDYSQIYQYMADLEEKLGFKLWTEQHSNGCCLKFAPLYKSLCCYELYYLNKKYIQT
jgi:hypothetical protein